MMFKGQEHKSCSCRSCRRGAASSRGRAEHRKVNRAIRHANKAQLKRVVDGMLDAEDTNVIVVRTDYTD